MGRRPSFSTCQRCSLFKRFSCQQVTTLGADFFIYFEAHTLFYLLSKNLKIFFSLLKVWFHQVCHIWWFLLTIKTVLLKLTECQIVLLLHVTKSLFVRYCAHKFKNYGPKKLTAVCNCCTIMCVCMLHN